MNLKEIREAVGIESPTGLNDATWRAVREALAEHYRQKMRVMEVYDLVNGRPDHEIFSKREVVRIVEYIDGMDEKPPVSHWKHGMEEFEHLKGDCKDFGKCQICLAFGENKCPALVAWSEANGVKLAKDEDA